MTEKSSKYSWFVSLFLFFCVFSMTGIKASGHSLYSSVEADTIKPQKKPQKERIRFTMPADTLPAVDKNKLTRKEKKTLALNDATKYDSLKLKKAIFNPSPLKATWLAMIF